MRAVTQFGGQHVSGQERQPGPGRWQNLQLTTWAFNSGKQRIRRRIVRVIKLKGRLGPPGTSAERKYNIYRKPATTFAVEDLTPKNLVNRKNV